MADRLDDAAAVHRISGVRDRVAEAEDGSVASDGRAGEEQEQHDEEAKAVAGGHRRGGTANHLTARFALEHNFSPDLGTEKKRFPDKPALYAPVIYVNVVSDADWRKFMWDPK
ncbi:hypothetical protein MUK42_15849 [Musa troglodytarum]|uniref:Uncharacterized protein n=1 Tax=Musa troglodytarum TaxID=320322 RepID=A0A9E7KU84_9LILI|nr:hypothetical protein MUK42_15849 [Musa troglodytarum]